MGHAMLPYGMNVKNNLYNISSAWWAQLGMLIY